MVRPHDDAESLELALIENMAREDLNPLEEARAVRRARRGAGAHARGGRPARRPLARGGLEPAAAARPARRGADADRGRQRSPRATVARCSWRPITTTRRRLARDAAAHGWSVRQTEERGPGGGRTRGRSDRGRARSQASATPTSSRPPNGSARRSAARSAPTCGSHRRPAATAWSSRSTRSRRRSRSPSGWASCAGLTSARRAIAGAARPRYHRATSAGD